MWSRVYASVGRPSVCLSHPAAARRCCGFAVVVLWAPAAGDVDRLLQQLRANYYYLFLLLHDTLPVYLPDL